MEVINKLSCARVKNELVNHLFLVSFSDGNQWLQWICLLFLVPASPLLFFKISLGDLCYAVKRSGFDITRLT